MAGHSLTLHHTGEKANLTAVKFVGEGYEPVTAVTGTQRSVYDRHHQHAGVPAGSGAAPVHA
ncbi:hypothetical protein, partial [Mycobacterium sp.]|uniref:hypothetical protein n=1 Tax=Mycobacterium sp. TaxID=1785 RepID=UPI003F81CDBF